MDIYSQIAQRIIESQEAIIGPVAVEQALKVPSLHLNWSKHTVNITGDPPKAIDALVDRYKDLFGQASVEVCKEAVHTLTGQLAPDGLPDALR